MPVEHLLLGSQIETMSETELAEAASETSVFARLAPAHKEHIIRALQSKDHVLGFMGDGINDALTVSPLANTLGFVPLPAQYWLFLAVVLVGYAILTQGVKTWLIRRFGE